MRGNGQLVAVEVKIGSAVRCLTMYTTQKIKCKFYLERTRRFRVEGRAQKVGGYLDAVVLEVRERLN